MDLRFAWPLALGLLALVPLAVAGYYWVLRRKRKYAVRYSSLSLIREAMPAASWWRRHLGFALLLAAIASLAVGAARPQVVRDIPQNRTSIILALDISRSMCAIDVEPNRLTVAQDAARAFISQQAGETKIGLVAFAGTARLIVPPTADTELLVDAVDNLRTAFGTTIGSAQLKSIDALADVNPNVAPASDDLTDELANQPGTAAGAFQSDIIVLLTDGANSGGPDPVEAAQVAADRRVRIYTIGFGTDEPTEMICGNTQIGVDLFGNGSDGGVGGDSFGGVTGSFGGGGGRGGSLENAPRQLLVIDEPTLQSIAELTGGAYFRAEDSEQLVDVFLNLPTEIEVQQEEVEVSVWLTAAALMFLLGALAVSLRFNRFS